MRCKALSFVWSSFGTQGRLPDLARFVSDAAPMLEHYVKKILTSRVYDVAVETPLHGARQLSERLGNRVLLKREDLQPVFSFKIRGAYNKLAQLTAEEAARGVV
ncbi:Threonine ammonia-lyase, biosynthetic, partial [Pseudomonas savastanoi pv. glycinea]